MALKGALDFKKRVNVLEMAIKAAIITLATTAVDNAAGSISDLDFHDKVADVCDELEAVLTDGKGL